MSQQAVYARQSVEKANSISIEGQIQMCQNMAGQPLTIYQDRGYSGKNTERPDFQRLLKDVKKGRISKLYVYRLDRFSRSVADFGRLWEILQANHVEFVSISENFDTSTPMGRAMLHIIMVFAQLERETTAQRVRDNYYRRAALGAWPGGPAPFGFVVGRAAGPDGRTIPTLMPGKEIFLVERIFQMYAQEEASLGSVARQLNREGIPAPRRATWDNVTLSRLFHNPAYVKADREVYLHFKALGAEVTSEQEDFDGEHGVLLVGKRDRGEKKYASLADHRVSVLNSRGVISSQLWLACQSKLLHNRQVGNRGKGKHTWLSGLLKCGKCGYSLKVVRDGARRYLLCSGRYNLSHCDAVIRADLDVLEGEIQREIQNLLEQCPVQESSQQGDEPFAQRLAELDRRADRLMDAFAESGDLSPVYLHRALSRLEEQRQALMEERRRRSSRPVLPHMLDFAGLGLEEKKTVAAQFIRRIDVEGDKAVVCWNV